MDQGSGRVYKLIRTLREPRRFCMSEEIWPRLGFLAAWTQVRGR